MKWTDPESYLMLEAASALALWLHRNQDDLQGEPYRAHLKRVAEYVRNHRGTPEQVAAAFLHDSIEDGVIDYETLDSIFPGDVATWVFILSREKASEAYEEYIDRICATARDTPSVLIIKLADLLDNLDRSRGPAPERLIKRYEAALPKIRAAMEEST